jgi:hypothetical protein
MLHGFSGFRVPWRLLLNGGMVDTPAAVVTVMFPCSAGACCAVAICTDGFRLQGFSERPLAMPAIALRT